MRKTLIGSRRGRVVRALALGTVLTGVFASSVSAATTQVAANDSRTFSPSTVTAAVGGGVHWAASGIDEHSVTQDQGVFDSGAAVIGLDFTRTFSAGTFRYHCEKHGDQGMVGVVRVAPQAVAAPAGLPFTVKWATARSNTGSRFDVQYRVGSGRFKAWKTNTTARSAVFGARSQPVRVARGKSYSFRVVSRASASARSAVSPVRTFRAS
jgi:plastocyanin